MSVFFKKTIWFSLVLIAFFSFTNIIFAQESILNSASSFNLNIFPSSPRAGDSVVLTLTSDSLDLDSSRILWYIDGVARTDTGSKSITIKTKNDGSKTNIRVVVDTSDGIVKEVSKEISPAGVDLIIEPTSYTMPFYKGKPFFVKEGSVKIIAIPDVVVDGVKKSVKDLNFKWIKDDYVLGSNSGKGQNSIIINSAIPVRNVNIKVEISDDSGNILTDALKRISLNDPKILFYEDSSLYGVLYNKAITGNYYLGTREELKIVAKPLSFSFLNDSPSIANYVWYANGNNISPVGKNNEIILRQTSTGAKGTASILLDLSSNNKINQYASYGFNVVFGQ